MADVRSFVAVPLPGPLQARVFAAVRELGRELPDVAWSRKVENLHVTIKFLGPVSEERLGALAAALEPALAGLPPFEIEVRGLGAFPSPQRAKVVWVGIRDAGHGLAAVAAAVEEAAARLGFAREERPFRAHVTVGRAKHGADARAVLDGFSDRPFGGTTVGEVHIYESRLGGEGSTYLLRARAALGAGAASN